MKSEIKSINAPSPIGPYSQGIMAGNILFISGQIALDPKTGQLISTDITLETSRVMDNIQAILTEAKMDFSNVVKASIFVKDLNNFQAINAIYGTYFKELPPARETVEVCRLPKDANVEISCIAARQ
jgi:2-iminobutanoate/2-iminopropanoate deaminase